MTTLTKRMAEDLTEYYQQLGSACAISIPTSTPWTGSRSSAISVWASSTASSASICCARDSTFPEVSLVAILDADKEGYLRSATSLIADLRTGGP